MGVTVGWYYLV